MNGQGTVKFFNDTKGFGFIAPDTGGDDVFVHVSVVERAGLPGLSEGDEVAFELEQDRRSGKTSAVDLQFLGSGARPQSFAPSALSPRASDTAASLAARAAALAQLGADGSRDGSP